MRLFLTWLVILALAMGAHAEELFSPGEPHKSHLDYRQYFETLSAQAGMCTLSFAEDAYSAETAQQVYAQLAADEAALAELVPVQPHTVYVVKKPLAGMQRIGEAIYCTAAQVLDGSYRPWLVEAAVGTERWQSVGLAGYAFDATADLDALRSWYADDAHDDMLSLCPAYFVEAFTTPEVRHMALQTAIALFGYAAEHSGFQAALTADASDYAQGYLASLGIDREYSDPYAGLLDGYTWGHNQFYPLIATSPKGDVFKLKPVYDMTTADRVRMALCELEIGVDVVLAGVAQDAPDWYPVLMKNYEAPITYDFGVKEGQSLTYYVYRRIEVGGAVSLLHETVHMMTPCSFERVSRYTDYWKGEAIAEHLTHAYEDDGLEQQMLYKYLLESYISTCEDLEFREFITRTREIYLEHAPMPASAAEVRCGLWWRAAMLAEAKRGTQLNIVSDVYANANSALMDNVNGNELLYVEAEWLASYLINRHGLSTFLHYCMDEGVSFEEAFSVPYEAAKADWLVNRSMTD